MPFIDQPMTDRQRFQAVMHYGRFDRGILIDTGCWGETRAVWREYGLPRGAEWGEFFGFDTLWGGVGAEPMLYPPMKEEKLADEGPTEVVRQADGTTVRRHKFGSSIPLHLDHLLKGRESWDEHFRWRLDPRQSGRIPADLPERMRQWARGDRPVGFGTGSLFGQLRNWMGLEAVSYLQHDDPGLFGEMVAAIGDCVVGTMEQVLALADEAGLTYDWGTMWEDMCFSQGPLVSLETFRHHLLPQYARISGLFRRHGCDLLMVDSDGDVRPLLPLWLQAGVNVLFPMEVGKWGNDPLAIRREFGRELRILGGFDKRILSGPPDGITREVERLAPMVEEGGFIPFCDHAVPPTVSLENYLHYLRQARAVWGRSLPNLRPMSELDRSAPRFGRPYDYRAVFDERGAP